LFDDQARLDTLRLATYNRLLAATHQKIKWASTKQDSGQMTYYDVPEWSPGCPLYDVKDAILYLVWNLRHTGFKVLYMGGNRLLINWKEQSIQYYTEESPIRQAMMATAAAGTRPPTTKQDRDKEKEKDRDKKKAATYRPAAEGVAGLLAEGGKRRGASVPNTVTFI